MRPRRHGGRNTAQHESLEAIAETRRADKDAVGSPLLCDLWQHMFGIAFLDHSRSVKVRGPDQFRRIFRELLNPCAIRLVIRIYRFRYQWNQFTDQRRLQADRPPPRREPDFVPANCVQPPPALPHVMRAIHLPQ